MPIDFGGPLAKVPPIGDFKRRITIQSIVNTADNQGGSVRTWDTVGTFWAYFSPWKGKKPVVDGRISPLMYQRCVIRFQVGKPIDASCRIQYGSRYFNIYSIYDIEERHEYLEMVITEGVAT